MKRKLVVLGMISPLLLGICLVAFLLVGLVSWLLLKPEEKSRLIRITTIGPLSALATDLTQPTAEGPAEKVQAPAQNQPATSEAISAMVEPETISESAISPPPYALPADSVSVASPQEVATRLVIPKMELDAPIVLSPIENQTWKVADLNQMVGHLEGTAPPGSNSNFVLAGHVTLETGEYGPFANLGLLAPGDVVTVYKGNQEFKYVIDGAQIVDRTAIEVTYPSERAEITLITCSNWNNTEGRYIERLIVKGRLLTN